MADWDSQKIEIAVEKALLATDQKNAKEAAFVVTTVALRLLEEKDAVPTVEEVQDAVEEALSRLGYYKTVKAYILYRDQHRRMREMKAAVSIDLIESYVRIVPTQSQAVMLVKSRH